MLNDSLPLHPAVVHFPIVLGLFTPLVVLILTWGISKKGWNKRVWGVALLLHAMAAGSGVLSIELGENEEERVEKKVSESLIEAHEETAKAFVVTSAGAFTLGAVSYFVPVGGFLSGIRALTFLTGMGAAGLVLKTGHSGGQLVYTHGAAQVYLQSPSSQVEKGDH